ncbi:isocitrate/isopropylmalate dehydrogenase family protein [Thalassobaculum sp.]|uniref:isocitrate/isopropylmalate dehydrogenase family protein n=1 Tax=Thalassobaculum sp. TaxID=2022740 RepID=UPI003B597359
MKLLMLPGDGIGPEITDVVANVLDRLESVFRLGLAIETGRVGLEGLKQDGITVSDATFARSTDVDGVILGPVDTASYPPPAEGGLNPSAEFRKRLDLYANIRPSRTRKGVPSLAKSMDLVIARENTEGFYADRTMHIGSGEFMPTPDLALAVRKITRQGSERIGRTAAALAAGRRKKLTIVTKSNVLKLSDGLFRNAVKAAALDQGGLEVEEVLVDAMASLLVREPERFDVICTTNMFGDILSNQASELAGGLGVAGSLNAGDKYAIAQAAHGTAPDIAGKGIANPTSLVLSTAMLIGWIARNTGDDTALRAAMALEEAVDTAVATPAGRTVDLGGTASTKAAGKAIADALGAAG